MDRFAYFLGYSGPLQRGGGDVPTTFSFFGGTSEKRGAHGSAELGEMGTSSPPTRLAEDGSVKVESEGLSSCCCCHNGCEEINREDDGAESFDYMPEVIVADDQRKGRGRPAGTALFLRYQFFKHHPAAGANRCSEHISGARPSSAAMVDAVSGASSFGRDTNVSGLSHPPQLLRYRGAPAVVLSLKDVSKEAAERLHRVTYVSGGTISTCIEGDAVLGGDTTSTGGAPSLHDDDMGSGEEEVRCSVTGRGVATAFQSGAGAMGWNSQTQTALPTRRSGSSASIGVATVPRQQPLISSSKGTSTNGATLVPASSIGGVASVGGSGGGGVEIKMISTSPVTASAEHPTHSLSWGDGGNGGSNREGGLTDHVARKVKKNKRAPVCPSLSSARTMLVGRLLAVAAAVDHFMDAPPSSSSAQSPSTINGSGKAQQNNTAVLPSLSPSPPSFLSFQTSSPHRTEHDHSRDGKYGSLWKNIRKLVGLSSQPAASISTAAAARTKHSSCSDGKEQNNNQHQQKLSLLPLVGLMFCTSIGGSYGLEESILAGGAYATLVGVIILPLLFALPVSMCVAELATSIPSNGGFLTWINVSMSPTLYFFSVVVTLMLTFIDNAAFPVLFADYVCPLESPPTSASSGASATGVNSTLASSIIVGGGGGHAAGTNGDTSSFSYSCSPLANTLVRIATVIVSCGLNLMGIEAVGAASLLITALSVAPFGLMFVVHMVRSGGYINWRNVLNLPFPPSHQGLTGYGASAYSSSSAAGHQVGHRGLAAHLLPHVSTTSAVAVVGSPSLGVRDIAWSRLLPALTWNVAGLEQTGSVAEDVKDPKKNFIKAALITIVLSWISYIPPVIAGVSRTRGPEDWSLWVSGYWATVASDIGGVFLYAFTVLGSVCSMFGLLLSAVCLTSRLMEGIGESGAFDKRTSRVLATTGRRFGTPHWSIIINTFFTGLCAVLLDFSSLVAVDQALYGIRILMIFFACIRLRRLYPTLERPFKIPFEGDYLVFVLAIPIAYSLLVAIGSAAASLYTLACFLGLICAILVGSHVYVLYYRPSGFDGKILPVLVALPGSGLSADSPRLPHIAAIKYYGGSAGGTVDDGAGGGGGTGDVVGGGAFGRYAKESTVPDSISSSAVPPLVIRGDYFESSDMDEEGADRASAATYSVHLSTCQSPSPGEQYGGEVEVAREVEEAEGGSSLLGPSLLNVSQDGGGVECRGQSEAVVTRAAGQALR